MREYSLNLLRWLKWCYLRDKYRHSKWKNWFAPKPRTKKYLKNLCIRIEKEIFNHPFNYIPSLKQVKYSGTIKVWPGDALVYQQDGSVITLKEANKYSQIESGFCEECEARIENAENMKCVPICETCARGLNKRTKIKVDNKHKMIAECKCRKQEIDIQRLVNRYGYIERLDWQCPVCWQTVNLFVKENNEEEV